MSSQKPAAQTGNQQNLQKEYTVCVEITREKPKALEQRMFKESVVRMFYDGTGMDPRDYEMRRFVDHFANNLPMYAVAPSTPLGQELRQELVKHHPWLKNNQTSCNLNFDWTVERCDRDVLYRWTIDGKKYVPPHLFVWGLDNLNATDEGPWDRAMQQMHMGTPIEAADKSCVRNRRTEQRRMRRSNPSPSL